MQRGQAGFCARCFPLPIFFSPHLGSSSCCSTSPLNTQNACCHCAGCPTLVPHHIGLPVASRSLQEVKELHSQLWYSQPDAQWDCRPTQRTHPELLLWGQAYTADTQGHAAAAASAHCLQAHTRRAAPTPVFTLPPATACRCRKRRGERAGLAWRSPAAARRAAAAPRVSRPVKRQLACAPRAPQGLDLRRLGPSGTAAGRPPNRGLGALDPAKEEDSVRFATAQPWQQQWLGSPPLRCWGCRQRPHRQTATAAGLACSSTRSWPLTTAFSWMTLARAPTGSSCTTQASPTSL